MGTVLYYILIIVVGGMAIIGAAIEHGRLVVEQVGPDTCTRTLSSAPWWYGGGNLTTVQTTCDTVTMETMTYIMQRELPFIIVLIVIILARFAWKKFSY